MPHIDQASQLAAVIRAQLTALRRAPDNGRDIVGKRSGDGAAAAPADSAQRKIARGNLGGSEKLTSNKLDQLIAQRVRHLSPDDPQRRRRAFRIFLESALIQEFGSELIGDVGFDHLVEQVMQQMESDDELQNAMNQAADVLLESNDAAPGAPSFT